MPRPVVVAYLSGHGYGHFVRSSALLERLAERATIHVRTNWRALGLAREAAWAASVSEVDVGPGVAQRGPFAIDVPATRAALAAHLDAWEPLVAAEAAALRALDAKLVYADVPPVAFAAAARAGVPSVGLTNFSWSWIYDGYAAADPWFAGAAARMREAEGAASLLLALDGGGGLESFPHSVVVAPLVQPLALVRGAVRARLFPRDDGRPIVLLSFGGFGRELDVRGALAATGRYRLAVVSSGLERESDDARSIEPTAALPHRELVAAADCVIGKPGYGTVSECLARPTPFCYVPRDDFREAPPLCAAIDRWLPSAPIGLDELIAGRWPEVVDRARASRPPEPPPSLDGIAEAVRQIAALLPARRH